MYPRHSKKYPLPSTLDPRQKGRLDIDFAILILISILISQIPPSGKSEKTSKIQVATIQDEIVGGKEAGHNLEANVPPAYGQVTKVEKETQ